jgi:type IV pilus assembly protein PilF
MADIKALYQAAFDSFLQQDYDAAIEGYQRAIEASPEFALAFQGLSEAYAKKGDLDRAIEAAKRAIELDPEEGLYHTSLSRFYQMQGRIHDAEEESLIASRLQFGRDP